MPAVTVTNRCGFETSQVMRVEARDERIFPAEDRVCVQNPVAGGVGFDGRADLFQGGGTQEHQRSREHIEDGFLFDRLADGSGDLEHGLAYVVQGDVLLAPSRKLDHLAQPVEATGARDTSADDSHAAGRVSVIRGDSSSRLGDCW